PGLVSEDFNDGILDTLKGSAAIGHVRYSTTGQNLMANTQPLHASLFNGPIAVAHNGNIVNAGEIRERLKAEGSIFQGTNDTEVILHLIAKHPSADLVECLKTGLAQLEGAFSITVLSHKSLIAARDPQGFRPLVLGRLGSAWVVASETCAFDLIGASFVREIEPGEIWWVDESGEHSIRYGEKKPRRACVFEHVYFARPDSVVFGQSVYGVRKRAGELLAKQDSEETGDDRIDFDLVIPVPDSGVPAALGYSAASGKPFELGIIRNHYIGRTFIQPHQSIRDFGVKIKLNPQSAILKGKRVVVLDDSLVRGTTSKKIIALIRAAGAKEVHLRIAAPPTVSPCYYGVDTPEKSQLIASRQSREEIQHFVGADSLRYLTIQGLMEAVQGESGGYCAACFDGKYPTPLYGLDLMPKGNIRGL
ncbi:MAG: amidophosphoribosyltransferase, partial [Bdellovibrionales bacterium]|nr:amidophosphoribosyltransferase [Bdellovibrionales bacterium]